MKVALTTILDDGRIDVLKNAAETCAALPGAIAEVGVYAGGSLMWMAGMYKKKTLYGIDTFEGMPPVSEYDKHHEGDFRDVDYEKIKTAMAKRCPNVILLKGFFPDDVVGVLPQEFAMVHVDCDIYTSVRDCCEFFWPRLVSGGMMVFDDPGMPSCPGAAKAFREFGFEGGKILCTEEGLSWVVRKN
jgi:O-methyltransferase